MSRITRRRFLGRRLVLMPTEFSRPHQTAPTGGYTSPNAAIPFIRGYAAEESSRAGLDIRFVTLPQLIPATGLGSGGVAGYGRCVWAAALPPESHDV